MAARLSNPAGSLLYRRRMAMIEPVFSHLTQHGGRDLHFRGPGRATELLIMGIAHNLGKLNARSRALGVLPGTTREPLKTLTIRNRKHHHEGRLHNETETHEQASAPTAVANFWPGARAPGPMAYRRCARSYRAIGDAHVRGRWSRCWTAVGHGCFRVTRQ